MVEKIIWTKEAIADLRAIYDYINRDSQVYANRTVNQIIKKVELIKKSTLAGRIVPEFNIASLREFLFKDFRIIYQIDDSVAYIVRIYHASKLLKRL